MKNFILFLIVLSGCTSAIRNENATVQTADTSVAVNEVVPVFTSNQVVTDAPDLTGYWVGAFVSSTMIDGEIPEPTVIALVIDDITGDSIMGHSVVQSNYQHFNGTFLNELGVYHFTAREPGDQKHDGEFRFSIAEGDSVLRGTWTAFGDLKVKERSFKLKKRMFSYDPTLELDVTYVDETTAHQEDSSPEEEIIMNYGNVKNGAALVFGVDTSVWTDSMHEQYHEWLIEEFSYGQLTMLSTTDKVFKVNPSTDTITTTFAATLTKADIYILRNSIYARHGYSFRKKDLLFYFWGHDWYMPIRANIRDELTPIEKHNIKVLLAFEEHAEAYYDYFGR